MFIVLYRWRIKPDLEAQFIEAWSEITEFYVEQFRFAWLASASRK